MVEKRNGPLPSIRLISFFNCIKRDKLLKGNTPKGTKRSPSTVVRYFAAFSHALTIAMKEWGWIEDSPMRRVTKPREPSGRVRFLSDNERSALLYVCRESSNPLLYPVVVLALSTGMRQGEIMNLRWENVDLFKGKITLHQTKNGERRTVPLRGSLTPTHPRTRYTQMVKYSTIFLSKEDPNSP